MPQVIYYGFHPTEWKFSRVYARIHVVTRMLPWFKGKHDTIEIARDAGMEYWYRVDNGAFIYDQQVAEAARAWLAQNRQSSFYPQML